MTSVNSYACSLHDSLQLAAGKAHIAALQAKLLQSSSAPADGTSGAGGGGAADGLRQQLATQERLVGMLQREIGALRDENLRLHAVEHRLV